MLLRCPTHEPFFNLKPLSFTCQSCGEEYVIVSDELSGKHHRCGSCGRRVLAVALHKTRAFPELIDFTRELGVTDVCLLATEDTPIDPQLREFCQNPGCRSYGSSVHCPPHSRKPEEFQEQLGDYLFALVFRFDVPTEAMHLSDRGELGRLLHETTAEVEHRARSLGLGRAEGFSSGGCRRTLCHEHSDCAALETGTCRHPDIARTSLSGLGVNFNLLRRRLGWNEARSEDGSQGATGVQLTGLVLLE